MTKEDFADWQRHPITEAVFTALHNRIQEGLEILGTTAGQDPIKDSHTTGLLRGLRELTEMSWEEAQPEGTVNE